MTMLIYEKLEDFLEKLETLEKTTAVYMTVVHAKKDDGTLVASIRIQFMDDLAVFHTFNYAEGIQPVTLVPLDTFDLIPDNATRNQAKKQYDAELDAFNTSITDEYEKAKKLFTQMGFTKVIPAYTL